MTDTPRFADGQKVTHNGRPAMVATVCQRPEGTRYHIFYLDDEAGIALNLLGRVLTARTEEVDA